MKRYAIVVITTAALVASTVRSDAANSHRCAPRGSVTVAATKSVRVYLEAKREGRIRSLTPSGGRTYGCLYRNGNRTLLAPTADRTLDSFHIEGNYVAFVRSSRVGRAEKVHVVPLVAGASFTDRVPGTSVTRLEITRKGSAAWIRSSDSGAAVYKRDAGTGGATLLDPGPTVADRSLAVGGPFGSAGADATVYWINSGASRWAPLR